MRTTGTGTFAVTPAATYAATCKQLSDALAAVGLTRTTDTGQVNWATVSTLPGSATIRDYEVYRLNDSLQATKPIYMRVDYGYTSLLMTYQITFGTSTDGAGNIGGVTTGRLAFTSATSGVGTQSWWISHDGTYLTIVWMVTPGGTSNGTQIMCFDRFRNLDLSANGDGYMVANWGGSNGRTWQGVQCKYTAGSYAQPLRDSSIPILLPNSNLASLTYDGAQYALPMYPAQPLIKGPTTSILWTIAGDFPQGSEAIVPMGGTSMKWFSIGNLALPVTVTFSAPSAMTYNLAPLFRWE
jgi:hypothetical protein